MTKRTHRLSLPLGFALVAGIIGLTLFAAGTPTPLYADYAARWDFSTLMLTAVYAVYAFAVLAALLLVGRLSDDVGRRPVMLAALAGLLASTVLFMLASSLAWLFAARILQGVATGAVLGTAGAALLDLAPDGDARRAGLVNGVSSAFGLGAGALISSVLVEELPGPRLSPFIALFVLVAASFVATLGLPESVTHTTRPRLRPQWPSVPRAIRGAFVLASIGIVSSWSIGGLYLALAPTLARDLLDTDSHVVGGAAVFALAAAGGLGQLAFQRLTPQRAMGRGSVVLAAGMASAAASLSTGSAVLFLVASAVTGSGFGVAFMGALRTISTAAPEKHRAAVMSAFYVVAYLSLSIPTIAAGLAVTPLGIESTFRVFSAAVVVLALVAAAGTRRRALFASAGV